MPGQAQDIEHAVGSDPARAAHCTPAAALTRSGKLARADEHAADPARRAAATERPGDDRSTGQLGRKLEYPSPATLRCCHEPPTRWQREYQDTLEAIPSVRGDAGSKPARKAGARNPFAAGAKQSSSATVPPPARVPCHDHARLDTARRPPQPTPHRLQAHLGCQVPARPGLRSSVAVDLG